MDWSVWECCSSCPSSTVIAPGPGMARRRLDDRLARADELREAMGEAPGGDPADQIARGTQLLDSGAIDAQEFAQLKRRAPTASKELTANAQQVLGI